MKFKEGYTVLELLIVIAIIGILATFGFARVNSTLENARISGALQFDQSILHGIGSELIALYQFEDDTTSGILTDSSGNDNNGILCNSDTCPGGSHTSIPGGMKGKAFKFDGDKDVPEDWDWIKVPTPLNSDFNINDVITISVWYYPDPACNDHNTTLVSRGIGIAYWLLFDCDSDHRRIKWKFKDSSNGTNNATTENFAIQLDRWTHIVATYDGQVSRVYIDGALKKELVLDDPILMATVNDTNGLGIGLDPADGNNPIKGSIDEVAIYHQALSLAQIKKLYAVGKTRHRVVTK